ncbi:MAG: MarP family serine protease [Intrasporangium sp.]|uniref:MarP family serine protease n=1 Tax=Intrasporangium sp. TaxID=1925024 RepID=UPI00264A2DF2|nr:MarP family serine protease [Intrasporangium sp.]MDN5796743.1 MarP family serine protease [Intrasporangium sp.]
MTGSMLIDLALAFVLIAYAVSGYRNGLITSVFSLAGFLVGAVIGVWQLPNLVARVDLIADDPRLRMITLVVGVIALGWLGQFLGGLVGHSMRPRVGARTARGLDSVLGAVVVVVAASLIIWFVGGALRTSGNPALTTAVSESRIIGAINRVVPSQTGQLFAGFRSFLSQQGFPQVFGGFAPEPITPVRPPDRSVTDQPAIVAAERSILKVTTDSAQCGAAQEGTGWVMQPDTVVTNAHVVAGAERTQVESPNGDRYAAEIVVLDPDRDLAVLRVPGLPAPALPLGEPLERGADAVVAGYPLDGPFSAVPARVRSVLEAQGRDIYGQRTVVREIYSLYTTVQPGNSGGPLLDGSGRVVGVVFAKSLEDANTGYALTLAEAEPVLEQARSARVEVPSGACLAR